MMVMMVVMVVGGAVAAVAKSRVIWPDATAAR